jgi:ubiquitin C-terminal hydrolase
MVIEPTTRKAIEDMLENNSSEDIRLVLYRMSSSLCDFQANLRIIRNVMDGLKLSKNSTQRKGKKMGMVNLGCTCYINSVIQQLQNIPPFRNGIISTHTDSTIDFFR